MSIVFTLISKNMDTILVEYTDAVGNFQQITQQILPNLEQNSKKSYSYEKYTYHYINSRNITYLCLTDGNFNQILAYKYLEDLMKDFEQKYTEQYIEEVSASYSLNSQFSEVIKRKQQQYNSNTSIENEKMNKLKKDLNDVKDVMVESIDKILEREQKVEILVKKTTVMSSKAQTIKGHAAAVKRKFYWENIKMKLIMAGVILLIIYLIVSMICGGLTLPSC